MYRDMRKGVGSRNLIQRLSDGISSDNDAAREAERFGADSAFVFEVRKRLKSLPKAGSQQNRAAFQPEAWPISIYRWIAEHESKKTDMHELRSVFESLLNEYDVYLEKHALGESITTQCVVDAAHAEMIAGLAQDRATIDAVTHRTPGAWRALAEWSEGQIVKLRRVAHMARVMASSFTPGATR